jgi:hypothetical protein
MYVVKGYESSVYCYMIPQSLAVRPFVVKFSKRSDSLGFRSHFANIHITNHNIHFKIQQKYH